MNYFEYTTNTTYIFIYKNANCKQIQRYQSHVPLRGQNKTDFAF